MKDRTKTIMKIVAAGLVAALLMTFAFFVPYMTADEELSGDVTASDTLLIPEETEGNGISLLSAAIPREDYDEYGIMPIAEKAYTLTATVNDDATVQAVDWTIEFENPSSGWASGKTVTDYVSFSSKGDLTATVQCTQAFGDKIIVSAVSRDNPTVKAECTCDYQMHVATITFGLYTDPRTEIPATHCYENTFDVTSKQKDLLYVFTYGKTFYGMARFGYSVGTIEPPHDPQRANHASATLRLTSQAKEKFIAAGYDPGETSEFEIPQKGYFQSSDPSFTIDRDFITTLFGANAFSGGSFYNALTQVNKELSSHILELELTASTYNETVTITQYMGLKTDGLYSSVSSVQLDESSLTFGT